MSQRLAELEKHYDARLGVYLLDTETNYTFGYRSDDRFPMCSTWKVLVVAMVLRMYSHDLGRLIRYSPSDLQEYAPITSRHVADGLTVSDLCDAALRYSDNTAANLLLHIVKGPSGITGFARSLGDVFTRLDRFEPAVNSAIPHDQRDTTTPKAFASDLSQLLLGRALQSAERKMLEKWMLRNTTGGEKIRAGVASGLVVADKTGSGDYGTDNDVAIVYSKSRAPVVLSVFSGQSRPDAQPIDGLITKVTKVLL